MVRCIGIVAATVVAATILAGQALADDLLKARSPRPVAGTIDHLQALVTTDGFTIVARVRHSESAAKAGASLRPTELLVFGKAQNGTPLMACDQRAGIDLPVRALAWQDERGEVWLGMVDPSAFRSRYDLKPDCDPVIDRMGQAIRKLLSEATKP